MSDTAPEEKPKPTEKPKRSRKRFILLALLTLGLASIPAILILEIGIRIAPPHYNPNRQVAYFVAKDGTPLGPTNKTVIQRTPKGDYNVEITFNELGIRDDKLLESVGIARRVDHPDLFLRNDLSDEAMQSCIDRLEPLIAEVRHAIFVIIPSRGLWMGNNREKERSIHESFVERLRELSPHVVDLRPVMEKNGPALDNYFKTDPHWNATGHKLAGEELATKILHLSEGP